MTLAELAIGEQAKVARVAGEDAIAARILEMGLTPGTLVTMRGRAPLGDPIEFEVRGFRLSLRGTEAARISVHASAR
jgi:Fe2+ transport system protein FeoA